MMIRTHTSRIALWTLIMISAGTMYSQEWCVPTSLIPYSASMPGITRFQLNDIDRVSSDLENYPDNSYVYTGLSTELAAGQTYSITIEFTVDQLICPDMNLRIWMDVTHDGQLDDVGETLLSVDHVLPNTYNGTITIPEDAMLGPTRMRVSAKMSDLGFHTLPTPCDMPADPFGYHGEMEDYDVVIVQGTGIADIDPVIASVRTDPHGDHLFFDLERPAHLRLTLYDVAGRKNGVLYNGNVRAGSGIIAFPNMAPGIYLIHLLVDDSQRVIPAYLGGQ